MAKKSPRLLRTRALRGGATFTTPWSGMYPAGNLAGITICLGPVPDHLAIFPSLYCSFYLRSSGCCSVMIGGLSSVSWPGYLYLSKANTIYEPLKVQLPVQLKVEIFQQI